MYLYQCYDPLERRTSFNAEEPPLRTPEGVPKSSSSNPCKSAKRYDCKVNLNDYPRAILGAQGKPQGQPGQEYSAMTATAAEPTKNAVLNANGRHLGTTNLTALVNKSHHNRSDMETYGHLRWSGSWMEQGMDFGPTKEPMVGEMCMTCFTTKAITGECGYCD